MPWRRKWQPTPVFLPGIPRTEEPDGLQSMGSKRVRQDWVTSTFREVYEVTLDFFISLSPYLLLMLKEMLKGLDFQSVFIPTVNFLAKNMYKAWGSCLLSVSLYAVSCLILNKQGSRQLSKQGSSIKEVFYQVMHTPQALRPLWWF